VLYAVGFSKNPTDSYTGIDAASKAAMIGKLEQAKELAAKVLESWRSWRELEVEPRPPTTGNG